MRSWNLLSGNTATIGRKKATTMRWSIRGWDEGTLRSREIFTEDANTCLEREGKGDPRRDFGRGTRNVGFIEIKRSLDSGRTSSTEFK